MIDFPLVKLADNLPEWMQEDPTVQAVCFALDRQFKELIESIPECIIIPRILELTYSTLVDLLAYQFHVDFYRPSDPLEKRRQVVQNSLVWHRRKGTVGLVEEVLDFFFPGGASLQEWYEYKSPLPPNYPTDDPGGAGTWHHRYVFRVLIDQEVVAPADEVEMVEIINRYKPASRWLEEVVHSRKSELDIYVGIGCLGWKYIPLRAPTNWP